MRGVLLCRITFALSLDVFFFLFSPLFLELEEGNKIGIANTRMDYVSFCCKKKELEVASWIDTRVVGGKWGHYERYTDRCKQDSKGRRKKFVSIRKVRIPR